MCTASTLQIMQANNLIIILLFSKSLEESDKLRTATLWAALVGTLLLPPAEGAITQCICHFYVHGNSENQGRKDVLKLFPLKINMIY